MCKVNNHFAFTQQVIPALMASIFIFVLLMHICTWLSGFFYMHAYLGIFGLHLSTNMGMQNALPFTNKVQSYRMLVCTFEPQHRCEWIFIEYRFFSRYCLKQVHPQSLKLIFILSYVCGWVCHVCLLASVPFPSVSVLHIPLFVSHKTSELASETAKREPAYVIFEFASKM